MNPEAENCKRECLRTRIGEAYDDEIVRAVIDNGFKNGDSIETMLCHAVVYLARENHALQERLIDEKLRWPF